MSTCSVVRLVPGPMGANGTNGQDGSDGSSAFTLLTSAFTVPAELASATALVSDSSWMTPGQVVYMQGAGWFEVNALPDSHSATLTNLEDAATEAYLGNVAPGTVIAVGNKVVPSGPQGPAGADGTSGAPVDATYITQIPNGDLTNEQALSGEATGLMKNTNGTGVISIVPLTTANAAVAPVDDAGGLTAGEAVFATASGIESKTAADSRTALGLGTVSTQAANNVAITGGSITGITDLAVADGGTGASTAAGARTSLNVLPGYGILGSVTAWNVNSATTDTAFTVGSARYIIDKIIVENASVNLTTATGGVFTAAGGGGTTIAADQALSALTASTKYDELTLQAIAGTDVFTAGTLYARCGTAQGGAATANLFLMGWKLD